MLASSPLPNKAGNGSADRQILEGKKALLGERQQVPSCFNSDVISLTLGVLQKQSNANCVQGGEVFNRCKRDKTSKTGDLFPQPLS